MMPSLTTIPRELRDQICTYVLLSPGPSPNLNQSFEDLTASREFYKHPRLRAWSNIVLYEPKSSTLAAPPLLLVNKQLHHETAANLALIAKHPNCSMDLIIADEVVLLPTWTHLPCYPTTSFDTVDVTFRISGMFDRKKKYPFDSYKGFRIGDGAGPAMSWQLYAVLERFLRAGTNAEMAGPDAHIHATAKTIRLDVQTPPGVTPERFTLHPLSRYGPRRHRVEGREVLDPGFLATFVEQHFAALLGSVTYDWLMYGMILYEHVDEIVVCKDGVETRRWDVAECLKEREVEARHYSRERMEEYKRTTWMLRKERGLKVLDE